MSCERLARLLAPAVLSAGLLSLGCDTAGSSGESVKTAAAAPASKSPAQTPPSTAAKQAKQAKQAEPAKPAKPKILGCDQRDFVPPAGGPPKRVCIDYTGNTTGRAQSCVQGTPLTEGCPAEDAIATCTMSTGTKFISYKGRKGAERSCKTLEGTFAKGAPAGAPAAEDTAEGASDEVAAAGGGNAHHCDLIKPIGHCFEWDVDAEAAKAKKEFCEGSRGKFSAGPCPADGDLGTCVLRGDKDIHFYGTKGHYKAKSAGDECTGMRAGTWTAK